MKKIIILLFVLIFFTGCGIMRQKDVAKEFQKKYDQSSGYHLEGDLEITNHDEVYQYDVEVDVKKEDYYKVSLTNTQNQFQQIILKNEEGVFLLTPSLNKSFKFQSDWPYNNSQIYLIDSLIKDIQNDSQNTFEEKEDSYLFHTKVNYPNNRHLSNQKIQLDKNYQLKRVTVYDQNDVVCMEFTVSKIKYSPKYDKDFFALEPMVEESNQETESTSVIEDVVYPLLLPEGTKLVDEEKVAKDTGERVIMTYDGEKSFLLVEETLDVFQDFTVIPSVGEPFFLMDTIGVMTDNSISWSSGNLEYYLVSDVMSQEELVEVAQSIVGINSFK